MTFNCFKRGLELLSSTLLCARWCDRALGVPGVQEALGCAGLYLGCAGFWGCWGTGGSGGAWVVQGSGVLGCAGLWCAIISVSGLLGL